MNEVLNANSIIKKRALDALNNIYCKQFREFSFKVRGTLYIVAFFVSIFKEISILFILNIFIYFFKYKEMCT